MAKGTTKVDYDEEEDILFLSKGRKVKASIEIGDFIIDVDLNGFVSGIEILNASENLSLSEDQLKELNEASMVVTYKPKYVYISLFMRFKEKEKDIAIPLMLDLGHGSVIREETLFAVV